MKKATSKNPNLTTETKKFIDALAAQDAPPLYKLTYEQARQVLLNAQSQKKLSKKLEDCNVEDTEFPVGPTGSVDVRIIRPKGVNGKLPVIVYYHGGGWVMGNKKTHDRLVRELAVGAKAAVFFVNYTPSPEAQFPVPTEQAYAALEYIVKNANKLGVDATNLVTIGDSVGGNMTAVTALMAKEKGGPKIKMQFLLYPVTDAGMDTDSYSDFADGPWLTKKAMEWFWDAYAPDKGKRKDKFVSPLQASEKDLAGLPPAMVITDENDVLRDEGEAYAEKLIQAGVDVTAVRYSGTIHDFMMLDAICETGPAVAATRQVIDRINRVFRGE